MIQTNQKMVTLEDDSLFLHENGLWTGKKEPLTKCKVLRNTNFTSDGYLTYTDVAEIDIQQDHLPQKQLIPGDILVERSGGGPDKPVGRVVLYDIKDDVYSFSNFTSRIRVKNKDLISPYYLHLYLLNFYFSGGTEKLQKRTTGIRNLDFANYKKMAIPLTPLSQQKMIVEKINLVKDTIISRKRVLETTMDLKTTLSYRLFHYGTKKESLKETAIGNIPQSWEVGYFRDLVEVKSGQVNPTKNPYANMIHVGPENIESNTGHLIATKTNIELGIRSGNYYFTDEDILYSKIRPYLNKVATPYFSGTCSADMYPLRSCSESLLKEFLFQYMLTGLFTGQAISFQDRTGIPKINRDQLDSIMIPLPSVGEQRKIVEVLTTCDKTIKSLKHELNILNEAFKVLLDSFIKGEITSTQKKYV